MVKTRILGNVQYTVLSAGVKKRGFCTVLFPWGTPSESAAM